MSDYKSGVQEEHGHSYLRFIYLNLGMGLQISTGTHGGGVRGRLSNDLMINCTYYGIIVCSLQIYLHRMEL